jgi:hypothetical protein
MEVECMEALIAMIVVFCLMVFPGAGIWIGLLSRILGGGVSETYIYPIYGGIILLTGFVVGFATKLSGEIASLKEEIENMKKEHMGEDSEDT